jgi:hypothetical protein
MGFLESQSPIGKPLHEVVFNDDYGTYIHRFSPTLDTQNGTYSLAYSDLSRVIEEQGIDPQSVKIRYRPSTELHEVLATGEVIYPLADKRVVIFPESKRVFADERPIQLQNTAYNMLCYLAVGADRVYREDVIFRAAWQDPRAFTKQAFPNVRQQLYRIRKTLETVSEQLADPQEGALRSIYGVGIVAVRSLGDNKLIN